MEKTIIEIKMDIDNYPKEIWMRILDKDNMQYHWWRIAPTSYYWFRNIASQGIKIRYK